MIEIRKFRDNPIRQPRGFIAPEFPPASSVDLEIGCGSGWHPLRYAQAHPDRVLIAIEHTRARFSAFESRIKNHPPLKNLLPIHADAVAWVTHALSPQSIERIFLLYPNPYPKSGDRNKRWHAMPFMGRLLETLKTRGEICLATNERFYFEEARRYFLEAWKLEMIEELEFDRFSSRSGFPRTHFEKKYLERGDTCFQLRLQKVGSIPGR